MHKKGSADSNHRVFRSMTHAKVQDLKAARQGQYTKVVLAYIAKTAIVAVDIACRCWKSSWQRHCRVCTSAKVRGK